MVLFFFRLATLAFPLEFRRRLGNDLVHASHDALASAPFILRPFRALNTILRLILAGLSERLDPTDWSRAAPVAPLSPLEAPFFTGYSEASSMEQIYQDFRYALRSLLARKKFVVLAVVTLGLGIGASTAMFTVVDGVLLRPLPYEQPNDLFALYRYDADEGRDSSQKNLSLPDLRDLQEQNKTLSAILGYSLNNFSLTGGDGVEIVPGATLTDGPLEVFGVAPVHGRDLNRLDAEPGAPPVALVSWSFFRDRLAGDPDIVGDPIEISSKPYTIVGVAPPGFGFLNDGQIFVPTTFETGCGRDCNLLRALARRHQGVSESEIDEELAVLGARLEASYPVDDANKRFAVIGLLDKMTQNVRPALTVLLGAVGLVLLIAAANVANLLLVRGSARSQELNVKSAIGASRLRLFRQLLIENGLLALGAAALGLVLGTLVVRALLSVAPADLPRLDQVQLDGSAVFFALTTTGLMLGFFGLIPAWRLSSAGLGNRSRSGSSDGRSSRRLLLGIEIALSLVLLLGAGLLLRSFGQLISVELGFVEKNVTTFYLSMPDSRYGSPEASQLVATLEERLAALPGVESVGSALSRPLGSNDVNTSVVFADRPEPEPGNEPSTKLNVVTPGYFATLETPLLAGRPIVHSDRRDTQLVALVNQAFVDRYFEGTDPLGERLHPGLAFDWEYEEPFEIVGVVGNSRAYGLESSAEPETYLAQAQLGSPWMTVLVRSSPGIDAVALARGELHDLDPDLPMFDVETLEQSVERNLGPSRFYLLVLAVFAFTSLVLAMTGLYGVIAFAVAQRRREIALRMALGADRSSVVRLVMREGLQPVLAGLAVGLLIAFLGARLLESLLYGIAPHDPLTYLAAALALLGTAFLACMAPARRASAIAPMVVLKDD